MGDELLPEQLFVGALQTAMVKCAIYLPDSIFARVLPLIEAEPAITSYSCAREDEGVAIAAGTYLGGKLSIVMMEGSGVGMSGLVLARAQIQRTPVLFAVSHTKGMGEAFDYHGATRLAGQGIFEGLGVPYAIVWNVCEIAPSIERAAMTARGQKTSFGLFFPPHVMRP